MKGKKEFVFLCGLYLLLPLMILHKSETPEFWRWTHLYLFIVIFYVAFVVLCTVLYLFFHQLGRNYCIFLIILYFLSFLLADFVVGSKNFCTHTKLKKHPVYHHELLPGKHHLSVKDITSRDHPYTMHVNAQGLRSTKDTPYKKPSGHFRILVLGDSFAEGRGANDDETFCYLVNRQLNQGSGKEDSPYEVLNAGADSYAPLLEYLYLKTKGIKFQPDFVLLFYDMSDLIQTRRYLKDADFDRDGQLVRVRPQADSWDLQLSTFLKSRFYFLTILYNSLNYKIFGDRVRKAAAIGQPSDEVLKFSLSEDQTPWMNDWQRIFNDIQAIHNFCRERNIGFAVVIYPWGHQVSDVEWDIGRKVMGIPVNYTAPAAVADMMVGELNKRGISTLNLFPVFRNYRGGERLYFRNDIHWRKEGHALAAGPITTFLKSLILGEREVPSTRQVDKNIKL